MGTTAKGGTAPSAGKSGIGAFFTKTVLGGVLAVLGWAMQPQVLNVLPAKVAQIVTGVGLVLGIFGIRQAIAKNGTGQ